MMQEARQYIPKPKKYTHCFCFVVFLCGLVPIDYIHIIQDYFATKVMILIISEK